jgi:protein phosphatase
MTGGAPAAAGLGWALDVFGQSDVGKRRSRNEDHFLVATLNRSLDLRYTNMEEEAGPLDRFNAVAAHLFVVADGVGGVAGGDLASGTAVSALAEYLGPTSGCCYAFDPTMEDEFLSKLEGAAARADERVRQHGPEGKGPATTLTMMLLMGDRAYSVHVGDSRGYHYRAHRLRQFTRDQTMGELMVDEGVMTEEQAEKSGLQNVLSGALGNTYTPDVGLLDLDVGDVIVLCTDGLTKHVSDDEIQAVVESEPTAQAMVERLVQAALDGGGSDNVTVIVARAAPQAE